MLFHSHVQAIQHYYHHKMAYHHYYTTRQQVMLTLWTLHLKYQARLLQWAHDAMREHDQLPFNLQPYNLGTMLMKWATELSLTTTKTTVTNAMNAIEETPPNVTCKECGV